MIARDDVPRQPVAPVRADAAEEGEAGSVRRSTRAFHHSPAGGGVPTRAGLRSPPVSRLASVYPLVSARSLARPFTYEVPDEVGKGAVVAIRFANARRRGVVVDADVEAPPGVEPVAIERVLETLPPALVDLALWLADYYGSTPARALGAGRAASSRRGAASGAIPALPRSLPAGPTPDSALRDAGARARAHRRARWRPAAGTSSSPARPAAARPRSTSARARRRSPPGAARSSSCRRSR